jgi:N-methylhydantoinase B
VETIPSKLVTTLKPGDRVTVETAGGGGFGDPRQRDRSLVAEDIANGKISANAAREIYGLDAD